MSELDFYHGLLLAWALIALLTFIGLQFVTAPYGRHNRKGWGPSISSTAGWVIMEAPAPILVAVFFFLNPEAPSLASWILLGFWELHYINRAFLFPFRRRGGTKPMPISIMGTAVFFNLVNAYVQGRYLGGLSPVYDTTWLVDPRFVLGAALFLLGFTGNLRSDAVLRSLRQPGETGYQIPRGWLFDWISCPNYLSEIVEWCGWALMTWSLPGLLFAWWTAANLVPRAKAHHRWYRQTFADYPPQRKALIPGLY